MKAFSILLLCLFLSISTYSQKKSGTVYSDHEAITKVRALWKAYETGDADAFLSFMSDTVKVYVNGTSVNSSEESTRSYIKRYKEHFENIKVIDHKPAYPDAIEYKDGGIWVQDWVKLTGIHKSSGINLDLPVHHLYSFNKDGKITSFHYYFNNDIFEKIYSSHTTMTNGTIYMNHPYISKVRKLMNAFRAKDIDKWTSYFSEKARFGNSTMKFRETIDLKTQVENLKKSRFFQPETKFKVKEIGYPDCMHYNKGDQYVVYSWWLYTEWNGEKKIEVPFLLDTTFDKDGKITRDFVWYSNNHFKK